MTRYAVINNDTRKVVNVVVWEGAEWLPPRNHLVVYSETAGIGDDYIEEENRFVRPNLSQPDPEEQPQE